MNLRMVKKEKNEILNVKMQKAFGAENFEQALMYCDQLLDANPEDFDTRTYKGACLCRVERYQEAINLLSQCIAEHEGYFPLYVFRGDSYYGLKNWQKAINDYKHALKIDPLDGATLDKCARSYFHLGNVNDALYFIRESLSVADDPAPFLVMIVMLKELGLLSYAEQIAKIGTEKFPLDVRFRQWIE